MAQARGKGKPHGVGIRQAVHVGVRVDAVVRHVSGSGSGRHGACQVRAHGNTMLRLRLRLPVVERPHAGERSRVRPVGI
jgi:hypothetical protein